MHTIFHRFQWLLLIIASCLFIVTLSMTNTRLQNINKAYIESKKKAII